MSPPALAVTEPAANPPAPDPAAHARARPAAQPAARAESHPRAFAACETLERAALLAAPLRWPRPSRLERPLGAPAGKLAQGLATLGVQSVGALLEHLPRERRAARTVGELAPGEQATIEVEVRAITRRPVRRRGMRPLVEATVFDATGTLRATFFNQPWLVERYTPGTRLLLHGKAARGGAFNVAYHAPGAELGDAAAAAGVAHYPAAEGVSSTQIVTLVREHRAALADVAEPLPAALRVAEALPLRAAALAAMHFPRDERQAEGARRRLAFEELLLMQLAVLRRRALRGSGSATALAGPRELTARWLAELLPFEPTAEQHAAIGRDRRRPRPRAPDATPADGRGRLRQDRRRALRAAARRRARDAGRADGAHRDARRTALRDAADARARRAAAERAAERLDPRAPARRRAREARLRGARLVVGTHALIEADVAFDRLAVAVVDEQHRFGVRQRAALDRKGPRGLAPHVLHMTATPIPRTLALTEYGDLDVTRLRELPRGRQPIATHVVTSPAARARAYERLREELRAGRQAYVVCPLVEESERSSPAGARRRRRVRAPAHRRAARLRGRAAARAAALPREAARDGALHRRTTPRSWSRRP